MILRLFIIILLTFTNIQARAQDFAIAAVVNGEAISNFSLFQRVGVVLSSAGMENTPQNRSRVMVQTLQSMINEILQRQDARENDIEVTKKELDWAIADIERKNNLKEGSFSEFIKQQGISEETLMEQINNQLLWKKIVARRIQPRITVSDYEIDDFIAMAKQQHGDGAEVYLSEIMIPFASGAESGEQEKDTLELAENLVKEINEGKQFSEIAKQFSRSATASDGGVIGWIPENNLGDEIREMVKATDSNSITRPIKTADGYRIFRVGNRRSAAESITHERAQELIMMRKIELESRKYIKNLRNDAFIELHV